MFLVTDVPFPIMLKESGINECTIKASYHFGSIESLLNKYCKGFQTAEIYWSANAIGICSILSNHGITPVNNVNKLQKNTTVMYCYNDSIAELITFETFINK